MTDDMTAKAEYYILIRILYNATRMQHRMITDMSRIAAIAVLLCMVVAFCHVAPNISDAQVVKRQTTAPRTAITFLTTDDFPPFNYTDEEGVLTG